MDNLIIKNEDENNLSPMMRQYITMRNENSDCILFFRVGDFYETFFDQAKTVSHALNLVLTGKDCGLKEKAPMCGVPYHAVDVYMSKLVNLGFKVAIAEQMEDTKNVKGIVRREVTKILTPGTVMQDEYLVEKNNNFILSLYYLGDEFGVALFDFSTGEFFISNIKSVKYIFDIFAKYEPKEVLINENINNSKLNLDELKDKYLLTFTTIDNNVYDLENLNKLEYTYLSKVLNANKKFLEIRNTNAIMAALAAYEYVKQNQKLELSNILKIDYIDDNDYMHLDYATIKNLELVENTMGREKSGSLLYVLDATKTAMGGRLIKRIIEEPLKNISDIKYRQEAVYSYTKFPVDLSELREYLSAIYDFERIMTRVNMKHANAKDLIAFKNSIFVLPYIKNLLNTFGGEFNKEKFSKFDTLKDLYELIDLSIVDDPPYLMHDGNIIKDGFNEEIDKLRNINSNSKQCLIDLEEKEKNKTGIKNLKIKYSRLTGYLFEISNVYKGEIPSYFVRKQTLANAERYATSELIELQNNILTASDRLKTLEFEVFEEVRDKIAKETVRIKEVGSHIAMIDVLTNFSYVAMKNNYVCPLLNEDGKIEIKNGRHPVVESLNNVETFISNDTSLDNDNFIDIITGPNMAGKSTYMRQVALIVLMAHIGCFVPADSANICICDRIFTRVGASDDLTRGKSTFMVEMSEMANIMQNATDKSLIILDEIGRGTSTYDGLSIAWSVIEYISEKLKSKTLFATHYHELTDLEGKVGGVRNFNVEVIENDDNIKFLRKIKRGRAEKSYGIAVARLAGVPNEIIEKAKKHLGELNQET